MSGRFSLRKKKSADPKPSAEPKPESRLIAAIARLDKVSKEGAAEAIGEPETPEAVEETPPEEAAPDPAGR